MSVKPCGCGKAQPEDSDPAEKEALPEIVPLPPGLLRGDGWEGNEPPLPDYLAELLVSLPEIEEGE